MFRHDHLQQALPLNFQSLLCHSPTCPRSSSIGFKAMLQAIIRGVRTPQMSWASLTTPCAHCRPSWIYPCAQRRHRQDAAARHFQRGQATKCNTSHGNSMCTLQVLISPFDSPLEGHSVWALRSASISITPGTARSCLFEFIVYILLSCIHLIFYAQNAGTGKTLLARAVANRTDACFIRVIGSELVQKYVGEGARMVRELFQMARSKRACLVFFDEVDAIGGARSDDSGGVRLSHWISS